MNSSMNSVFSYLVYLLGLMTLVRCDSGIAHLFTGLPEAFTETYHPLSEFQTPRFWA